MRRPRRTPPTIFDALLAEDVSYVVSACPTCTVALKQDFIANLCQPWAMAELPAARAGLRQSRRLLHSCQQLVNQGRLTFKEGDRPRRSSPITTPAI